MSDIVVRYGLTTAVLGERFKTRALNTRLPKDVRDAWWRRTDYGWVCSACPDSAGVNWPTLQQARQDALKHAHDHGGVKVEPATS